MQQYITFEEHRLYFFKYKNENCLLAKDVGAALGIVEASNTLRNSEMVEKGIDYDIVDSNMLEVTGQNPVTMSKSGVVTGQNPVTLSPTSGKVAIVYQSGLWALIYRSNKKSAVDFKRLVIREIIPAWFAEKYKALPETDRKPDFEGLCILSERAANGCELSKYILIDAGFTLDGDIPPEYMEKPKLKTLAKMNQQL